MHDAADLDEARRLLRHLRDHAPGERDSMVKTVLLQRDIAAAGAATEGGA